MCLGVLKHRAPLDKAHLPAKNIFTMLMWCNFKFEGVLLQSDSRQNDRVDSLPPLGQGTG